jgi:hypothetical protein
MLPWIPCKSVPLFEQANNESNKNKQTAELLPQIVVFNILTITSVAFSSFGSGFMSQLIFPFV